jgi:hypothetical protein
VKQNNGSIQVHQPIKALKNTKNLLDELHDVCYDERAY